VETQVAFATDAVTARAAEAGPRVNALTDPANRQHTKARSGFAIVRAHRNGDVPRDYLRSFLIVGRSGLAQLAYGPRAAAHLFEGRGEAEDVQRRLRRRTAIGGYDYFIEEAAQEARAASD